MIKDISKKINHFFTQGHVRSIKAKKNIFASFIIKGASVAISLILVPLTLNYINASKYGIWLTLSSIVAWFSFFDIGLSQGLRNKFAEAKAKGEDNLAQIYVSTTYAVLSIVFFLVWSIFLIVNHFFLNWTDILNVSKDLHKEVSTLALIVFTYFCIQFILKIITTLIIADQQPAKSSLIDLLGQVTSLAFIFILVKTTEGSLVNLGIALCASPLIILASANLFFFNGKYKEYQPRLSKVKFSYAKGLYSLGLIFFVIQVAHIIQFQTANIIIARNYGTTEVTSYNIVYKYFNILNMFFVIFLTPFWSASTEAYLKNEIQWIKNAIKKYNQLNIVLIIIGIVMLSLSGFVYRVWLGEGTVDISFKLSFWGFLYFTVIIFASKYVFLLNGINALRLQFLASIVSPIIFIATALILIKFYELGVYSLFVASIIANFNGYILAPIQYHMVINKNKKGIWVK